MIVNDKFTGAITPESIAQKNVPTDLLTLDQLPNLKMVNVSPTGDITLLTTKDQLIWLHPAVENNKVVWTCYGAPNNLVTHNCQY